MAQVEILEINAKQGEQTLKSLRKDIIDLKNELLNLEEGTEDYNKALTELGNKQFVLKEINEQARASASDLGEMVGNTTNLASGLVSAFQGVTAALNLMGVESETSIKILAQMQNLMALTQGLQGIDDGIKAYERLTNQIKFFVAEKKAEKTAISDVTTATNVQTTATYASNTALKAVKATLMSLGIGLVVAALGSLIANWDKVTASLKNFFGISSQTNEEIEKQKQQIEEWAKVAAEAAEEYNKIVETNKIKKLNTEAKKSYEELNEKLEEYQAKLKLVSAQQQQATNEEKFNSYNKELDSIQATILALEKQQRALLDNVDSYKTLNKEKSKTIDTTEKEKQTILDRFKTEEEKLTEKYNHEKELFKDNKDVLQLLEEQYQSNLYAIKKRYEDEEKQKQENERQQKIKDKEQELIDIQLAYENSRSLLLEQRNQEYIDKETYENLLIALEQTTNEEKIKLYEDLIANQNLTDDERLNYLITLNNLKQQLYQEDSEAQEEAAKKATNIISEETQKRLNVVGMFANATISLLSSVSNNLEEGSKEWKAVNIAMATISMLQGVVSAMTSAFSPANAYLTIWGQIALASITTATVIASGIANINKIKNTKTDSSNSISSSTTPATTKSISNTSVANSSTNIDGLSNLDSAITSGQITGSVTSNSINSQKVYVTETDITNTQNKVNVLETETTF